MSTSPGVLVVLGRDETSAAVLRSVKSFTGAGLLSVRGRIVAGEPVIDEEMFTNAWFDERADLLLDLLTAWREQGIVFELRESLADADAAALELEMLRHMVEAAQQDEERC
ncbi:hypothetical protein [Streptomyces sp. DvalAA-19]|uniref:hypothetical protein n=1 Tax=Streptomyces sp. DvalAA-19 TaxID=1839761 RepID=UPI00081B0E5E|nr:hypothetical protein [Streptomyces sp. DvalAA-19]SCE32017.1 hypothetical protein GA0115244_12316 [Streptomyces sp. DvalAA-19]